MNRILLAMMMLLVGLGLWLKLVYTRRAYLTGTQSRSCTQPQFGGAPCPGSNTKDCVV